jgi:DNA-directed RNA polymerase subunit RPC12/RpoP
MLYKCVNCGKEFDQKIHYINHLRRKIPCINKKIILEDHIDQDNKSVSEQDNNITDNVTDINDNICSQNDYINVSKRFQSFPNVSNDEIIYECSICHKKYNTRSGLFKHKKVHPIIIEEGNLTNVEQPNISVNDINNINELNTDINNKINVNDDLRDQEVINEKIIQGERLKNVSSNDYKCSQNDYADVSKRFQNDYTNEISYKCLLCNKIFNNRSNLWRHKKLHPNYNVEADKLISAERQNTAIFIKLDELIKKTEEQQEIITGLTGKKKIINKVTNDNSNNRDNNYQNSGDVNNPINNGTVNTLEKCPINNGTVNTLEKCPINNGTINNYIVQFGKEDTSKLNQNEVNNILCSGRKNPLLMAIEYLHFNKRLPEQQNIRCTNIHSKYIDIYDGKDWIKELSSKIVDELYLKRSSDIEQLYNSCDGNVKSRITSAVKRVIETFNVYDEYDSEEKHDKHNKKLMSFVDSKKEDIKLLLHNKTKTSDI